jgi:hypothetical protein
MLTLTSYNMPATLWSCYRMVDCGTMLLARWYRATLSNFFIMTARLSSFLNNSVSLAIIPISSQAFSNRRFNHPFHQVSR